MNSFLAFVLSICVLLGFACQNAATTQEKPLPVQIDTEVQNIQAAKQNILQTRKEMDALRVEVNNLPESVKADTSSGFSEIQRKMEIFESKSNYMLTMYDEAIPALVSLKTEAASGMVDSVAQQQFDRLAAQFDHKKGLEVFQKYLKALQEEVAKLK